MPTVRLSTHTPPVVRAAPVVNSAIDRALLALKARCHPTPHLVRRILAAKAMSDKVSSSGMAHGRTALPAGLRPGDPGGDRDTDGVTSPGRHPRRCALPDILPNRQQPHRHSSALCPRGAVALAPRCHTPPP